MPARPYKPIQWVNEPVTSEKLNDMANNDQWNFENTPRIRYVNGVAKEGQLKILTGMVTIPPGTGSRAVNVNFGNFFSPACSPIITTGVNSYGQRAVNVSLSSLTGQPKPDSKGMIVYAWHDPVYPQVAKISHTCYISWMAVGF